MINILLGKFIICIFLIIVVCEIKTSEVPRPHGVPLSRVALYPPDKDFTCFDGSLKIPFIQINDNYCDCADGSDEPGTSACPNGLFYCTNAGHRPLILPSSRVNDGICDCCDASDEYATTNSNCVNNCNELGRTARVEAQKRAELIKLGSQMRSELSQKGILLKQEKKEKLLILNRNKHEAELVRKEKETLKKQAEDLETIALQAYQKVEEEPKPEDTDTTNRNEASEVFNRFDSNQDGKLEISELQTRPTFDRDRNGEITEEEARFFLNENSEVNFEDFFAIAWPKIKPFLMMESGLFKPPSDDQENEEQQPSTNAQDDEEEHHHQDDDDDDDGVDNGFEEDTDEHEEESEHEPDTEIEDTPPPLQYDEETQKLINQANDARQEFNSAEEAWRNLLTEIKDIEDCLQKDYGTDEEFSTLDGQCFEYSDREYIYKFCPFDQVTQQPKAGGSDTRLGQWGSWAPTDTDGNKFDVMIYDKGQSCWNGPQRSVHVRVQCASENALTSVAEPNRCEYVMDFTTPAACNPALVLKTNEDSHDEL